MAVLLCKEDAESEEVEEEQVLMVVSLNEFMEIVLSVKQVVNVCTHLITQTALTHHVASTPLLAVSHLWITAVSLVKS